MSYAAVLGSAVGLVGLILLISALVGVLAGLAFIGLRRLRGDAPDAETAARLHLNSLR